MSKPTFTITFEELMDSLKKAIPNPTFEFKDVKINVSESKSVSDNGGNTNNDSNKINSNVDKSIKCSTKDVLVGYVVVTQGTQKLTITGRNFGDYESPIFQIFAPNGIGYGGGSGDARRLEGEGYGELTGENTCTKISYTGWKSEPKVFTITNPIAGKWKIQIDNYINETDRTVKVRCSLPWTYSGKTI